MAGAHRITSYLTRNLQIHKCGAPMERHLLQCECGNGLPVRTSQAGECTVCPQCNATVDIPSLRELTKLPDFDARPRKGWFAFLPERSLPKSTFAIAVGISFLLVALSTPLLILLGAFENAFSNTDPADPRRRFFDLNNLALWGGLAFLALSGFVSVFRGLGYPIGGGSRT